jgi:hypothetical protein
MLADQESRGVGGVYRFSATSLRRAFDLGWSAAEVEDWLERHSTTGLPQALRYLVGDAERRHGSIRVGPAGCYVRIADQTQVAALLAHPAASRLGLRSVGPEVLVAAVDEQELLLLLRELGHSPAVENAAGELIATPPSRRAESLVAEPAKAAAPAAEVAEALLTRGRRHRVNGKPVVSAETESTVEQLRSATRAAAPVRVVYVNADGSRAERELAPLDLTDGAVRAIDRDSAQIVTIPLARIASVIPTTPRP